MTTIGIFTLTNSGGFTGEIVTLTLRRKVTLAPSSITGVNAPDLRVYAGHFEIGAAWKKSSKAGEPYFAVRLDDPSFPAPVWANLVESRRDLGIHSLLWDRSKPGGKAE